MPFATEIYVFTKHQKIGEANAKDEEYVPSLGLKEVESSRICGQEI
ncbi:hypothetical protein [Helicobacter suis]|nr:hypothetical protein [Helicobacter suis]